MVKVKVSSKKILKKPTAGVVVGISAEKTLQSFGGHSGQVVREAPQQEFVPDTRSQFFKSELQVERRGIDEWLR